MLRKRIVLTVFILLSVNTYATNIQHKDVGVDAIATPVIVPSKKHKPNTITLDLDGDSKTDTVQIVQNRLNNKYGLKVVMGNKKIYYSGMGRKILGQYFDDLEWVGVFEVAPRGSKFIDSVAENGELLSYEEAEKRADLPRLTLKNDGIFIHAFESCGGGVIYWDNEKFNWFHQE